MNAHYKDILAEIQIVFYDWSYLATPQEEKEVLKMANYVCKKLGILDSDVEL
jgi:hypothetical protein